MTQIPAGWYPDPAPLPPGEAPRVRYWDGALWTEHISVTAPPAPPLPAYGTASAAQRAQPGPTTPDGVPLAGWWWRVLAHVIDGVALSVLGNLLTLPLQISMQRDIADVADRWAKRFDQNPDADPELGRFFDDLLEVFRDQAGWIFLVTALVTVAYQAGFLRWKGATPGKLAVGLRVRLREQSGRLPWSVIAIRVAVQSLLPSMVLALALLSGSVAFFVLGYLVFMTFYLADSLWPTWDAKRQALHDKAAGTNVVKVR